MSTQPIYRKYFQVAGLSIEVRSDIPFKSDTFASKFDHFEINKSYEDNVVISHHFFSTHGEGLLDESKQLYFRPPWAIYRRKEQWVYQWVRRTAPYQNYYQTIVANRDHSHIDIYNDTTKKQSFLQGGLNSLTMFPTDQILLGRVLAERKGCIVHSVGLILESDGFAFIGHSDAGKSTMALIMKQEATILCDDRNIIRKGKEGFTLSGTWSHGDVLDVSANTAPLKGIFFLNQAKENSLEPIKDVTESFEKLLPCLIRPLETREWWEKSMDLLAEIAEDVPCWQLNFDKSGKVLDLIKNV